GIVAVNDESHARQVRVLGFADGQAVDVEAARRQHAGDMSQHAGLVLHQGREHVSHAEPSPRRESEAAWLILAAGWVSFNRSLEPARGSGRFGTCRKATVSGRREWMSAAASPAEVPPG